MVPLLAAASAANMASESGSRCVVAATLARYWMTFLVFSVFPAPDSPVHRMDWSSRSTTGGGVV